MKYCFIAITLLIAAAVVLTPYPACSDERDSLDVVLVMDSSGSMKKTDPHSRRIPAARLFISLLDGNDRAGVVSFSDSGYPIANLTPIDSEEHRDTVLSAVDRISSNGLYTNLHDALSTGLEVLSGGGKSGRPRFIILMSDGMMDAGDPDKDRALIDKVENSLPGILKEENIRVYAIAFTGQSDTQLLERVSKRTGGFYNLAVADKDLHMIFTSIFESLKKPEMLPVSENGFFIDNSIEEVTIVATKGSPSTRLNLKSPDGQVHTHEGQSTGIEWFVSDNFDMITVSKPAEGRWDILFSTGENNRVYIITNLTLHAGIDRLHSTFGDPLELEMWLEKDGSIIAEKDVLDKIGIQINLASPDGKTTTLTPFSKGGGVFVRKITPFTPGNYKVSIVAKGSTFEREKSIVFNVADVAESKVNVMAERAKKKEASQQTVGPREEHTASDGISWKKVVLQFLSVNAVLCILIFGYFRLKRLNITRRIWTGAVIGKISGMIWKKKEAVRTSDEENEPEIGKGKMLQKEEQGATAEADAGPAEDGPQEIAPEEGQAGAAAEEPAKPSAEIEGQEQVEARAQPESEKAGQEVPLEEEGEGKSRASDHGKDAGEEKPEEISGAAIPEVDIKTDETGPEKGAEAPIEADTDAVNSDSSSRTLKQEDLDQLLNTGDKRQEAQESAVQGGKDGDSPAEESVNMDDLQEALQAQKEAESGESVLHNEGNDKDADARAGRDGTGAHILEQEDLDQLLNTGAEEKADRDEISLREKDGDVTDTDHSIAGEHQIKSDGEDLAALWEDALKKQKNEGAEVQKPDAEGAPGA